jgi:hypothetical protein
VLNYDRVQEWAADGTQAMYFGPNGLGMTAYTAHLTNGFLTRSWLCECARVEISCAV